MRLPFKIVSRARWNGLREETRVCRDSRVLLQRLRERFDADDTEPKLLRSEWMTKLVGTRPAAILDIGANVGTWSRFLAERFSSSVVHAVEADPRTVALLRDRVGGDARIVVHHLAMHAHAGKVTLNSHANNLLSSLLVLADAAGATTPVEVEATTLDSFVSTQMPTCPTIVKVDTEGNDQNVLDGGRKTLADPRLKALVMEFGFDPEDRRHVEIRKLVESLLPFGLHVHEIDLAGVDDGRLYGNVLFGRA